MRLKVRDVLGVVSADIPLNGITLVAGVNGAGKSSLLAAAAAVAMRQWAMRGVRLKADASKIVRDGAENGAAVLEWSSGALRMRWPEGTADATGDGDLRKLGSSYAIGAARWMDAEPRIRMADLADRLNTRPTVTDARIWLEQAGVETSRATALAEHMIGRVEEQAGGWDAVHRAAQEQGVKLKGKWEQVTGQRWGANKVQGWTPAGLLSGETYTLADAEEALEKAEQARQSLIIAGAVSAAEVTKVEISAAQAPDKRAAVAKLQTEAEEIKVTLDRLHEQLDAMPAPPDSATRPQVACPHCGKPVLVLRRGQIAKPDAGAPTPEQIAERAGIERALADVEAKARDKSAEISRAEAAASAAERDAVRLAELRAAPRADTSAIAAATAEVARLEARRDAIRILLTSRGIYEQWRAQQPIIDALAPGGVRQSVIERRVVAFNAQLSALSEVARWSAVALTPEGDSTFGGRPYGLLSESEKWRVDLTLQVAFAMQEKAALMLVDRLDVLTPQARLGAALLLHQSGIPSLVAMTQPNADKLPDLSGERMGRTAWIEHGIVRLL